MKAVKWSRSAFDDSGCPICGRKIEKDVWHKCPKATLMAIDAAESRSNLLEFSEPDPKSEGGLGRHLGVKLRDTVELLGQYDEE